MDEQPKQTGIRVSRAMMEHTARAEEFASKALQHQEGVRKNQKLMREEFQAERRRAGQRLTQLEAQVAVLTDSYALLRAALDQLLRGAPTVPAPVEDAPLDPKDAETIIEGFTEELHTSRDTAEGTMRSMDPPDRRRLFSILNTELGRLKNQEALLGSSIPRRADVEELIGILAKVGEA